MNAYVEPFVGGGSILFSKAPVPKEVVDDLDPQTTTLFNTAKEGKIHCNDIIGSQDAERELVREDSKDPVLLISGISAGFIGFAISYYFVKEGKKYQELSP